MAVSHKKRMTRAQRNIQWIEKHCYVPEGVHVGKPMKLLPFQKKIVRSIYDGKTRRAIISFAGKNGKTALTALFLLLHLVGPEAVYGSSLYSTAQSREQAAIIFRLAAKIVQMSPTLSPYVGIRESKKELYCEDLGTVYRALSAEATTAHGISPIFSVHDELGQVEGPRSDLYDVVERKMGAHAKPLSIIISTQAETDEDLLSVLIDDAIKNDDPRTKLFLFSASKDCRLDDPKEWKAANPALGVFLNEDEVKEQSEYALRMPSMEASFRNLTLNQRVRSESLFIGLDAWKRLADDNIGIERLAEAEFVYGGLDLSGRTDLTALVWIGYTKQKEWLIYPEFFAPNEGIVDRSKVDRVPYDLWAKQGHLNTTPGSTVDYSFVAEHLMRRMSDMPVKHVMFDPWRIAQLQEAMKIQGGADDGGVLQPFAQIFKNYSPAMEAFEADFLNLRMKHNGNPCMNFCVANSVVAYDFNKNRMLNKRKSRGRIDGMVALLMAYGGAITDVDTKKPSVYNERGIRRLSDAP
jgi:phage terminase large subunit-like protein